MVEDTEPRSGLSLAVRLFLAMALLVTLAVASAVMLTRNRGSAIAADTADENLKRASAVQDVLAAQRREQLQLRITVLTSSAAFAAYLEASVTGEDTLSLLDQLEQAENEIDADLMMLLDPDGLLIVSTREGPEASQDLSTDPLVREALEAFESTGAWVWGNRLYDAVVEPVATGSLLVGFLVAGFEIDSDTAEQLSDVTGADATIFSRSANGQRLVATTLDPTQAEELVARMAESDWAVAQPKRRTEPMTVDFQGQPWLVQTRTLWDVANKPMGAVVTSTSLAAQREPFDRLNMHLLWIGLGAILLSLPLSFLLARRILDPVAKLASAARTAAEGDYDQAVATSRRDELGTLSRSFDVLLSDLRERRDMERYVTELGRSLPTSTPASSASSPAPTLPTPNARVATVMTVNLPRARRRSDIEQATENPALVLDAESQDLRRIAGAIAAHGGTVEAALGRRLVASFHGEERAARAMAASAALHTAEAEHGSKAPAIALTNGLMVNGAVSWDGRSRPQPTIAGPAADESDRLLSIAKSGEVVVARSLFAELESLVRRQGMTLDEQPEFSSALPLYMLPADLLARLSGPAADVTWVNASTTPTASITAALGDIAPGQMISGRYEVVSTLGSGGMGVVYQVRDHELDELVAMKMLKPGAALDQEHLERMKLEIKLARKITHPNVLRTFDFGDFRGAPFITMEYVPGITLRHLFDRSDRLPLSAGLRLARQLCRGLEAAHGVGILHRDIKPENLIVEPSGNAKLMDFGIARRVTGDGGTTQKGVLVGTPFYIAPEQVGGEEPDERADLYACGAIFYELFTGRLPFEADANVMSILQAKLERDPPPPSSHWPEIPPELDAIIRRCMARDRDDRYAHTGEVLAALAPLRA